MSEQASYDDSVADGYAAGTTPLLVHPTRFGDVSKLAAALAKAQGAIEDAAKDSTNPHFKSKYADLAAVRAAIRAPLSENGIAYVQLVRTRDKMVEVETLLIHESGQSIGETLGMPLLQSTPQAVGSAISYGRRYSLMSVVGLAADDDDAEAAQGRNGSGASFAPNKRTRAEISAQKQVKTSTVEDFARELQECETLVALAALEREWADKLSGDTAVQWHMTEHLERRRQELSAPAEEPTRAQVETAKELVVYLRAAKTPDDLKKRARTKDYQDGAASLTEAQREELRGVYADTFNALQAELVEAG